MEVLVAMSVDTLSGSLSATPPILCSPFPLFMSIGIGHLIRGEKEVNKKEIGRK